MALYLEIEWIIGGFWNRMYHKQLKTELKHMPVACYSLSNTNLMQGLIPKCFSSFQCNKEFCFSITFLIKMSTPFDIDPSNDSEF
jgi:hypothetical protein